MTKDFEKDRQRCDDGLVRCVYFLRALSCNDLVVQAPIAEIAFIRDFIASFHPSDIEAELAEARSGNRYAQLERLAIKRAERAEAALAEARKALELAEQMMTKDSLCEAERLEEGLLVVRRALTGGKNG